MEVYSQEDIKSSKVQKLPEEEVIDVLECTLKIDTTLEEFEKKGGAAMFENNLA